jgi:hypothetical protein
MKRRPWNDQRSTRNRDAGKNAPSTATCRVKIMPEYQAELPLWGQDWKSLNFSATLLNRLADWQDDFDANFDPLSGWKTSEARQKWAERSIELIAELQAVKSVELEIDLWPLDD